MKRNGWMIGSMIVVGLLVVACSASSGRSTAPPSAAPASAVDALAAGALADGMFVGHSICREAALPSASPAGPGLAGITCEQSATDPRMAGTLVGTYRVDQSHPTVVTITSEGTLTNSGGSWVCKALIMGVSGGAGGQDEICTGRGGYVGLIAYDHGVSGNDATDMAILGWIADSGTFQLAPAAD